MTSKGVKRIRDDIPQNKSAYKNGGADIPAGDNQLIKKTDNTFLSPNNKENSKMHHEIPSEDEDKENFAANSSDPFFYQKGHKMVLLSTKKYSLSPALVQIRSPQCSVSSTSPTLPPVCYPPLPEILTECVLLANLDSKSSEITMLQKKLRLSETDRLVAEARFSTLQIKYLQSQKDLVQKVQKKKTVIQRVAAAVGCTVNSDEVYSPKGKQSVMGV